MSKICKYCTLDYHDDDTYDGPSFILDSDEKAVIYKAECGSNNSLMVQHKIYPYIGMIYEGRNEFSITVGDLAMGDDDSIWKEDNLIINRRVKFNFCPMCGRKLI